MSDGSPVPMEDPLSTKWFDAAVYETCIAELKAKAEAPQAEVDGVKEATTWLCKEINRAADSSLFGGSIRLDRAKVLGDLGLEVLARHRINERIQGLQAKVDKRNDSILDHLDRIQAMKHHPDRTRLDGFFPRLPAASPCRAGEELHDVPPLGQRAEWQLSHARNLQ